jgi:predicted cupin superfamily sugar epimerase
MIEIPDWAQHLELSPHPEGGWYRETWRSELTIAHSSLPRDYTSSRSGGTAILFLLMPGQQSGWHSVRSTEIWLYHQGSPLLLEFGPDPVSATTHLLGTAGVGYERPQIVVPPGYWQRAVPRDSQPTLVSCIVVPGFDFEDFSLASSRA